MRIAVTADPYLPVPPLKYGGIERVVDFVVRGLVARQHEVTLFAHPESRTTALLIPYGTPPHAGVYARTRELAELSGGLWRRRRGFDAVLSWGRLASLIPILPDRSLPKLQRYCRDSVPWNSVSVAIRLAGESIVFAGASTSVYGAARTSRVKSRWRTIFDGVELAKYDYVANVDKDAPLVFLGRIERIKGVHSAIAIARKANRRLIIAGNRVDSRADANYFENEIVPNLGDDVTYIGPVDDVAKNRLLGNATALLMPTEAEEGFGLVMAEAFACGTPVIAFSRGSVPEIVQDGINGFTCSTVGEAVDRVSRLNDIDRSNVRSDCESRFGSEKIIDAYESTLLEMIARRGART